MNNRPTNNRTLLLNQDYLEEYAVVYHEIINSQLGVCKDNCDINAMLASYTSDCAIRSKSDKRSSVQTVGVIPIHGILTTRLTFFEALGGDVCSYEYISKAIDCLVENGAKTIIFDIDSPGGDASGIEVIGDKITGLRESGITAIAHANTYACSAAYWIASCCEKIYANRTSVVGSIGVICTLYDESEMYSEMGVKPVVIATGSCKGAGVPGTKITDEQIAMFKESNDVIFSIFKSTVSAGRKMPMESVSELATGKVWVGDTALTLGLIDGTCSFEELVREVSTTKEKPNMAKEKETVQASAEAPAVPVQSVATWQDIDSAFANATAEFKLACLREGLTVEGAKDKYIALLESVNTSLNEENSRLTTASIPKTKSTAGEPNLKLPGNSHGVAKAPEQDIDEGCPDAKLSRLISQYMHAHLDVSREEATESVFIDNPELRLALIGGANG